MQSGEDRLDWRLVWLVFVVVAGFYAARALLSLGGTPLINDTDDAMRMVEVRDFLAGQNWFDLTQYRLDTPFGVQMHWSRLVDLPIGLLILALRPFAGASADTLAAFSWPLALLLVLLALCGKLAVRVGGRGALLPALVLTGVSLVSLAEFSPGRVDHHSVQILLTFGMLLCSIAALDRPIMALGSGLAAAAALAVGIESLPAVAATTLAFVLLWTVAPRRAPAMRLFGLSFGGATLLCFIGTTAPALWLTPACDAISLVYLTLALGVAAAFTGLSLLPLHRISAWLRLGAGLVAGATLMAVMAVSFPGCLGGPYGAVDPWIIANWMNRVDEARPFWSELSSNPAYTIAVGLPALLGLAVALWQVIRSPEEHRAMWAIYAAFLLLAVLVMLLQLRASRMATSIAIPAGAWLVVQARAAYIVRPRLLPVLGLVSSWIGFAGFALAVIVASLMTIWPQPGAPSATEAVSILGNGNDCRIPEAYAALATLPTRRLMTPIDLGAHILLFTSHSVVAAPYHRDGDGLRDAMDFFNQPIDGARAILARRGITTVVICADLPEMHGHLGALPGSFVRLLQANQLPDWLQLRSNPADSIQIYEVAPL